MEKIKEYLKKILRSAVFFVLFCLYLLPVGFMGIGAAWFFNFFFNTSLIYDRWFLLFAIIGFLISLIEEELRKDMWGFLKKIWK